MEPPSTARSFLTRTKLEVLTKKQAQDVVVLRQDATVELALKTLAVNKILSAPVVTSVEALSPRSGPVETANAVKDIVGFIDLKDVLCGFLKEVDMPSIKNMKMLQRLRVLEHKGQEYACKSLKDLDNAGGDGGFLHSSSAKNATLREIIHSEFLYPKETRALHGGIHTQSHVHRLALFDKEGRITNIISQSDVVKFLLANAAELGTLADQTAQELGWASKSVISVSPERPAIEAMEIMAEKNISAVAVVANGRMIGNFSVSELRTIMSEHFGSLALPIGEFLALEHGTEYDGYTIHSDKAEIQSSAGHKFATERQSRARPTTPGQEVGQSLVVCPPSATFKEIMDLVVRNRIHRVYVIDDEKPVGVVTLTDVLKKVVETDL